MAAVAPTVGKFDIANEELANFNQEQAREKNLEALQRFGGVRELGAKLLVDLKKGLSHDEEVLHFHDRRAAYPPQRLLRAPVCVHCRVHSAV